MRKLLLICSSTSRSQTSIGLTSLTSEVTYVFFPFYCLTASSFFVTIYQGSTSLSNLINSFIDENIPQTLSVFYSKSSLVMPSKHLLR
jgi:hypothetical protein